MGEKEIKYIKDPANYLVESGLLFQINRGMLHPLGLAMEVTLPDESDAPSDESSIKLWDCRDDAEGVVYSPQSFERGIAKYETYMEEEGRGRVTRRFDELGYVVQDRAPKVFLGGTCAGSTWRDELIPKLEINYFNPVVKDWTPECQQEELKQREECTCVLYVITNEMKGVYSIAEVIDDSNKRPETTLFCYLPEGFDKGQIKSLEAVANMVTRNGGFAFTDLDKVAGFLNQLV